MEKFKQVFSGVVNYLAAVGIALVIALFMSGRIGWFLIAAFICAPVISVVMTLVFKNSVTASGEISSSVMSKGDSCELIIKLENSFFLPTPPITVELFDDPRALCSVKRWSVSLMPFSEEEICGVYTARICGPCKVGVSRIYMTDYFGILSFRLGRIDTDKLMSEIAIIPDISDISERDTVVSRAEALTALADDSEDTVESTQYNFGGFPGYDSREYVPGDPLKRINWKQSAKKGTLLVRLDDEVSCSSVSVVLDSVFMTKDIFIPAFLNSERFLLNNKNDVLCAASEAAVEDALGIVRVFLRKNYSVTFFMHGENGWQSYSAADESILTEMRTDLASYRFSEDASDERFPEELLSEQKGSVSIFCTPYLDKELYEQLKEHLGKAGSKGSLCTEIHAAAVSPYIPLQKGGDAE